MVLIMMFDVNGEISVEAMVSGIYCETQSFVNKIKITYALIVYKKCHKKCNQKLHIRCYNSLIKTAAIIHVSGLNFCKACLITSSSLSLYCPTAFLNFESIFASVNVCLC